MLVGLSLVGSVGFMALKKRLSKSSVLVSLSRENARSMPGGVVNVRKGRATLLACLLAARGVEAHQIDDVYKYCPS